MGDLAVGARSGHDGRRSSRGATPWTAAADGRGHGVTPGVTAAAAEPPEAGRSRPGRSDSGDTEHRRRRERRPAQRGRPKKPRSFWKELPLLIGIALVLALLIKTFLVQAFSIPSDSMQNTLQQRRPGPRRQAHPVVRLRARARRGRRLPRPGRLAGGRTHRRSPNARAEGPQLHRPDAVRGGEGPDQAGHRRSAATPSPARAPGPVDGQRQGAERAVRLPRATPPAADDQRGQFTIKVPKGRIWVMGDHRQNSLDSRYHQSDKNDGMVPVDKVVGPRHRHRLADQPLGHPAGAGHLRPDRPERRRGVRGADGRAGRLALVGAVPVRPVASPSGSGTRRAPCLRSPRQTLSQACDRGPGRAGAEGLTGFGTAG